VKNGRVKRKKKGNKKKEKNRKIKNKKKEGEEKNIIYGIQRKTSPLAKVSDLIQQHPKSGWTSYTK